jgi:hypothetical protein
MYVLGGLSIKAKKAEVLATLRKNREEHRAIVIEARAAYCKHAEAALLKKLDAMRSGKVVKLSFSLAVPLDYTTVYDTAIHALEMHTDDTIELSAEQVRNLIEDSWDWTSQFTSSNALYSKKLQAKFENLDSED